MTTTCHTCTLPATYQVPGISHEEDLPLCARHAHQLGFDLPLFTLTHSPDSLTAFLEVAMVLSVVAGIMVITFGLVVLISWIIQ